jgi:hypothetical protein
MEKEHADICKSFVGKVAVKLLPLVILTKEGSDTSIVDKQLSERIPALVVLATSGISPAVKC